LYDATGTEAPGGAVDAAHPISGTVAIDAAVASALESGAAYVNVHTETEAGGAIRGQIGPYGGSTAFTFELTGASEVPPVETSARGSGSLALTTDLDKALCLIEVQDIGGITAAHIHRG
jgi:hypothetical protein